MFSSFFFGWNDYTLFIKLVSILYNYLGEFYYVIVFYILNTFFGNVYILKYFETKLVKNDKIIKW